MTYLIQSTQTREYFHNGNWTPDSSWAEEFQGSGQALEACVRYRLREVELVLRFGFEAGRNYSLNLRLPEQLLFA